MTSAAELPFSQRRSDAISLNASERNPVITPLHHSDLKIQYDKNDILVHTRPVELQDGTRYLVTSSQINKPLPSSIDGLSYHESVAFCTRPEGMYVRRLIKMAELGIEGTVISSPQNFRKYFTFDENAHNQLSIFHNEAVEFDRDPNYLLLGGISQGAMYGNGTLNLAPKHDVTPLAAHLSVPCLPDGIGPVNMLEDLKETITKAPNELRSLMTYTKVGLATLLRMGPTVDANLNALYVQAQCVPALLSGRTGHHAKRFNDDTLVLAEVFLGDGLSRGRVWRDKVYTDKPRVKVIAHEGGAHMDCITEESQVSWLNFQSAVVITLRENARIRSDRSTAADTLYQGVIEQFPHYHKSA